MINTRELDHWVRKAYHCFYNHPYHATPDAPNTWASLQGWADCHDLGVDSLPVFDGGSDNTIYGSAEVNYCFRAWHDCNHLTLGAGFTLDGELAVFALHVKQLTSMGAPVAVIKAIEADGIAQVRYYYEHGKFVEGQASFIRDCLTWGIDSIIESGLHY